MEIAVIATSFKPLRDLFAAVLVQGTTEDPLFKLADVAKYLGDGDRYTRTTKDFGPALKVKGTYHDGVQHRNAEFLTERGLYKYVLCVETEKADEFFNMIADMLKEVRKQVIDRLTSRLKRHKGEINGFPYPKEDIDDQVQFKIVTWTSRNISDQNAIHFPHENVNARTRNCIKKCLMRGEKGKIHDLMCEAYQEFYNLLILGIDPTPMPLHDKCESE